MAERGNLLLRRLDRWLGIPLTGLTACTRLRHSRPPEVVRSIGLICLGAIGDLLLLSALTKSLRRTLPQVKLEAIVSRANAGAVSLLPGLDSHVAFAVHDVPSMIGHMRRQQYDVLLDSSQWARLGAVLCNLSAARYTVGFDTRGQYRAAGYDYKVIHRNDRHEVENFLALGRALFPGLDDSPELILPTAPPDEALQLANFPRKIFLHMWPAGINAHLKEWPAKHWATLARYLLDSGYRIFLSGSPADAAKNNAFLAEFFPAESRVCSLAGILSLPALAWALSRAQAVISVNTGIMHLAALAGASTIGLHGATNPLRWGPVGKQTASLLPRQGQFAYLNLGFEYPHNAEPALAHLPPEDVLTVLQDWALL